MSGSTGKRLLIDGFGASRIEDGLIEEIRFHIDQQTEKNIRAGMQPDEARRQAFIKFGGVEHVKEQTRDEFRPALLRGFRARPALRRARAAPRTRVCHRRHPDARSRHWRGDRRLQRRQRRAARAAAVSATRSHRPAVSDRQQRPAHGQRSRSRISRTGRTARAAFAAMAEMSPGPAPVRRPATTG